MKPRTLIPLILAFALLPSVCMASARSEAAEQLLRLIYKSGDEAIAATDGVARAADLKLIDDALKKYGPAAREAVTEGGTALLGAARRHGDGVIEHAVRVPEAARLLGTRTDDALKVAKRFGDNGLRVEAAAPKLLSQRLKWFTKGQVEHMAQLPPAQLKTLGAHLSHVADAQTARRLVEAHRVHGPALLTQIPKKYLIGSGVLTVLVIDKAVNEMTGGEGSRILDYVKTILLDIGWKLLPIIGGILGVLWLIKWAFVRIAFGPLPKYRRSDEKRS